MASSLQASETNCNYDARGGKRSPHLSSTIEKLARAGEQAGFSVEEMIEMLNAGVSIGALLDMISYSLSQEAPESTQEAVEESTSASAPVRIQEGWREYPWIA